MPYPKFCQRLFGRPAQLPEAASREALFQLIAENSADVIFQFGMDMKARYISPSAEQLFGLTPTDIKALNGTAGTTELIYAEDKPMAASFLKRHLAGEFDDLKLDFRIVHRDGRVIWVQSNCRLVRDSLTGEPAGLVLTLRDISLKKQIESELSELARTDGLTGLANRRSFDEALDREWARTMRGNSQISLLLVDVDHFKHFNDRNGHQVGDDCLRTVAASLTTIFHRPADLVARYGGEEFAIILADTGQDGAVHVAEQTRAAVEALHLSNPVSEANRWLSVSIGAATAIATAGGSTERPAGLLQAADRALYRAKAAGRNCVETALLLSQGDGPLRAGGASGG